MANLSYHTETMPTGSVPVPDYTYPSKKRLAKLPTIVVRGEGNRFRDWMLSHPEIDRRVPPAFPDFVVEYEDYTVDYHYTPTMTGLHYRIWIADKAVGRFYLDYVSVNSDRLLLSASPTNHALDQLGADTMQALGCQAALNALGVQAYMLYHKPELVEQIYTPGESHGTTAKKHKVTQQPIKIRKTKIKRITLTEQDTPKKEIHYNKLSWHVRGHYRHVGKDKHLVYIQPSVHNRNGKKYSLKGQTYEIEDDK